MQSLLAFLFESGGIAAAAAKIFCGLAAAEALINGFGSWGGNNILKALLMDASEGDASVAVKAAGNNGAVAQNAYMIPQTVAKAYLRLGSGKGGPIELISVLKKNLGGKANVLAAIFPGKGEIFFEKGDDLFVATIFPTLVPKAQRANNALFRGFGSKSAY